jgi:hypothetical protein
MKQLLIIPVIFLTLMVGNPAWADWTKVSISVRGDTHYVDFETIKDYGGSVYYWTLTDFPKPHKSLPGVLSLKVYEQGDCNIFRLRELSGDRYKKSMGQGDGLLQDSVRISGKWVYPIPGTSTEVILKTVCNYVKNR